LIFKRIFRVLKNHAKHGMRAATGLGGVSMANCTQIYPQALGMTR